MSETPFHLRIPAGLKKQVSEEAKARRQSLNAYLLTLIETHQARKADIDRNRKLRK